MPDPIFKEFHSFLINENKIPSVVRADTRAGFDSSTVIVPIKLLGPNYEEVRLFAPEVRPIQSNQDFF
jgi:hypothetical protein